MGTLVVRSFTVTAFFLAFCLSFSFVTPASAAPVHYKLSDHPDGGLSAVADYGIRLDAFNTFFSFDYGISSVGMSVDAALGTAFIAGVVAQNNNNGSPVTDFVDYWELSYTLSGLTIQPDGTFVASGGSGSLTKVSNNNPAPPQVINFTGKQKSGTNVAMEFTNGNWKNKTGGYVGLYGTGWIMGDGWGGSCCNDFAFIVEEVPGFPVIPQVPVPAALPLFLTAFGVIGWIGRRRRSPAAA